MLEEMIILLLFVMESLRGIHVDDPEDTKIQVNRIIKEIKELEEK